MKSVDLQTTVSRSTEIGRDLRVQNEQNQQQAQELASQVSRDAERKSQTVSELGKVDKNRVGAKKNRQGKGGSGSRKKKAKERGRILDVTCDS